MHDYLVQRGGGERVVEVLHEMYPEVPIYTSVSYSAVERSCCRPELCDRQPSTSEAPPQTDET